MTEALSVYEMGRRAKAATQELAQAQSVQKNAALDAMAAALLAAETEILAANRADLAQAEQKGASRAMLDRLALNPARLQDMAAGLWALMELSDPIGEEMRRWRAAKDIEIIQQRVPLGVVGIIYEARPNVTADAAGISLKCGNAVILRGGSDALRSNLAVGEALRRGVAAAGLPADAVQVVADGGRESANELMHLKEFVDVLIPRGGAGLIQTVLREATVPVIETGAGNCHIYIEKTANPDWAEQILLNAKVQRPAVCNAVETLLIDRALVGSLLPRLVRALSAAGVEVRGCNETYAALQRAGMTAILASEADFAAEYSDLIIACKVVGDYKEAVAHINKYGTRHSECIVTDDVTAAAYFQSSVDAAAVYVNASTRFTDGFQFGFGAEIGISTQKLHARGPMGLIAMTTYKYLINGQGQTRP